MRKKPYPVTQIIGGEDAGADPVYLLDPSSSFTENVRFNSKLVKKGFGRKLHGVEGANGLPLAGGVMALDTFILYEGIRRYIVTTEQHSYYYAPVGKTYTNLNANDGWSGNQSDRFCSASCLTASGSDAFVLTNGRDPIKTWNGNTSDSLANLTGWANVTARSLVNFASRLVVGHTTESNVACPKRVRWSIAGNISNTTGTGSGFVELVETPDDIRFMRVIRNRLFVFKDKSIWELGYVGGNAVFTPSMVVNGVGSQTSSFVDLGDAVLIYSHDDVYYFDGSTLEPVSTPVRDLLYNSTKSVINLDYAHKVSMCYNKSSKEALISFVGADESIPRRQFIYNLLYRAWSRRDLEVTAYGEQQTSGFVRWDELVGTWADQTWNWNDNTGLGPRATLLLTGDSQGYVYIEDGVETSNDYMCFDSKDFIFESDHRWIELEVQAKGNAFSVKHSIDGGVSWLGPRQLAAANNWTSYRVPLNISSARIRFRFESQANEFELKYFVPWYVPHQRTANQVSGV